MAQTWVKCEVRVCPVRTLLCIYMFRSELFGGYHISHHAQRYLYQVNYHYRRQCLHERISLQACRTYALSSTGLRSRSDTSNN